LKRNALDWLADWKNSSRRKPLILQGARQVGKTWLMKEFAKSEYDDFVYISFDQNKDAANIFAETKEPKQILERLGLIRGRSILPEKTLVILDEIQECPNALGSLKYFNENANEYHVMAAGSLLGTYLAKPMSYPVGKVNLLDVYPLTFDEYLAAEDAGMGQYYASVKSGDDYVSAFHEKMTDYYKKYLIIGGMPECVSAWVETRDPAQIGSIQNEIIKIYENDFSKHNGKINSGRILMVFRSIVTQLAKENKRFVYNCIKEGARAREFEEAIEWLVSAGMVIRTYNVSKPEHPLNVFAQLNHFKLFMFDVGLLKYMAGVNNQMILLKSDYQFKGAITENYVLQQIRDIFDVEPKFFSPSAASEIDFIVQDGGGVIPIEVKGGETVASGSFKGYIEKYKPKTAIRYSMLGYQKNDRFINIPLYLARKTNQLILGGGL